MENEAVAKIAKLEGRSEEQMQEDQKKNLTA